VRLAEENLMNHRFELYSIILQSLAPSPAWVLLTDTRDVFFQGEIAAAYELLRTSTGCDLFFASEDPSRTISSCRYNRFWFEFAFGSSGLTKYGEREISCAGTTLGSAKSILRYLDRQSYWFRAICEEKPFGRTVNSDQAIHNMIAHKGEIETSILLPNGKFFLTVGYSQASELCVAENIYYENQRPTVIHQYDRIPLLKTHAENRYAVFG